MTTQARDDVRAAGRYEWEQIVRRARFTGAIAGSTRRGKDGRPTKGGISATTIKAIAFAFASYANDKGAEIWPGDATIAVDLECALKTVTTVKQALLDWGLMRHVGTRRGGNGEEYRLTLPADLLDRLEVLTPAAHKVVARRLREERRGKRGGSAGPTNDPTPDPDAGGPADPPSYGEPDSSGGSAGPARDASGGSAGPALGGPADPRTDHDRTSSTETDQPLSDLRTAVTPSRATGPQQDQISPVDADEHPPGRARADPPATRAAVTRCPDHPALPGGTREDGAPHCPVCRAATRRRSEPWQPRPDAIPRPAPPPDAPTGRLADVVNLADRRPA